MLHFCSTTSYSKFPFVAFCSLAFCSDRILSWRVCKSQKHVSIVSEVPTAKQRMAHWQYNILLWLSFYPWTTSGNLSEIANDLPEALFPDDFLQMTDSLQSSWVWLEKDIRRFGDRNQNHTSNHSVQFPILLWVLLCHKPPHCSFEIILLNDLVHLQTDPHFLRLNH